MLKGWFSPFSAITASQSWEFPRTPSTGVQHPHRKLTGVIWTAARVVINIWLRERQFNICMSKEVSSKALIEIPACFYKRVRLCDPGVSESHLRKDVSAVSVVIVVLFVVRGNVRTSLHRTRSWAWHVLAAPPASVAGTGGERIELAETSRSSPEQQELQWR